MKAVFSISLMVALFFAAVFIVFSMPPIPQDPAYHNFVDKRVYFNIKNFFDVSSNIFYIVVGIMGLMAVMKYKNAPTHFTHKREVFPFVIAFIGISFIGVGSAYYHLNPTNETLVWDRLPMTIGFMALIFIVLRERIHFKGDLPVLLLLLVMGAGSVWYWHMTEADGQGDLRFYILIQFFPMLLIPLVLLLFKAKYRGTGYIVEVLFWYVLAKVCEYFDHQIFHLTHEIVSGHTLKHLTSALAIYSLVQYVKYRRVVSIVS
jgi:hypothetical protein